MSHTCTITLTIVVHNKKTTRKEHNENKNKKHHLLLFYRKNDVIVNRSFPICKLVANLRAVSILFTQKHGAHYRNNHSSNLLLSKSIFFLYDSSDGGSRRVAGPCSL
jgi:hypothetical protein